MALISILHAESFWLSKVLWNLMQSCVKDRIKVTLNACKCDENTVQTLLKPSDRGMSSLNWDLRIKS